MQKVLLTLIMIVSMSFTTNSIDNEAHKPVVVLELFTSQGCSSCPSADALLHQVKKDYEDKNVIALSYHVAYWDYIGWKDPFASKSYANKQRAYANKFGSNRIYTPQLVVNGKEDFVGSNRSKMQSALKTYMNKSVSNSVSLGSVEKDGNAIDFKYAIEGSLDDKQLRLVVVIDERETFVKRGENSQRTLKNTNIVVSQKYIELEANGKASITIPDTVIETDTLRLIVLVEADNLDITGASQISL